MVLTTSTAKREERKRSLKEAALQAAASGGEPDDNVRRKAVTDVVQLWLDRLQLVSVITSFFASIDTTLLSFTTGLAHIGTLDAHLWSNSVKLMNASLAGALIFHVCAAITSFVGSFVLIRYKLIDAKDHVPHTAHSLMPSTSSEMKQDFGGANFLRPDPPHFMSAPTFPSSESHGSDHPATSGPFSEAAHVLRLFSIWQSTSDTLSDVQGRVFIHQVRPFSCFSSPRNGTHIDPPVHLLSNCHSLSVTMATLGFILALVGILAFMWTSLPVSVAAFTSASLGTCVFAIFVTLAFS